MYYVIQVKTGKEQKVIDDIKKSLSGSEFRVFDVFAPYRKCLRKYKDGFREVMERCFPGYIFVETDDVEKVFFELYWIPHFTKLLGREGLTYNFVPLDENETRMVDILYNRNNGRVTEISDIEVQEGDLIRVLDGPLMDLKGRIIKVNLHKRKVVVEIPLFNGLIKTEMGINIITRVDN